MITKKNVLIFGGGAYNAQEVYFALRGTVRYNLFSLPVTITIQYL